MAGGQFIFSQIWRLISSLIETYESKYGHFEMNQNSECKLGEALLRLYLMANSEKSSLPSHAITAGLTVVIWRRLLIALPLI